MQIAISGKLGLCGERFLLFLSANCSTWEFTGYNTDVNDHRCAGALCVYAGGVGAL